MEKDAPQPGGRGRGALKRGGAWVRELKQAPSHPPVAKFLV